MLILVVGSIASAQAQVSTISWESLSSADEAAIPSGTTMTGSNGDVTMTVNWSTQIVGNGSFVPAFGDDFVSYEAGTQGNQSGIAQLGFNNRNDDPNDKVIISFTFSQPVTGLSFSVLDVDRASPSNQMVDAVEIFADGNNIQGTTAVSAIGSSVNMDNENYMQGYEGVNNAADTSTAGNIDLDFGGVPVTTIRVEYFSSDDANNNPWPQSISVSDFTFNGPPSWTLDKTSTSMPVEAGDIVSYSFALENTAEVAISGITLSDANCDAVPSLDSGDSPPLGILGPDETWTYHCSHIVTGAEALAGSVINTATASGTPASGTLDNVTDSITIPIVSVNLSVTKTILTPAPYLRGQSVTYLIKLVNNGPSVATGVTVRDDSVGLDSVQITDVDNPSIDTGDCAIDDSFPCDLAAMANGETVLLTVGATIQ